MQVDADSMVTGHRKGNEAAAGIVGLGMTRYITIMMFTESLSELLLAIASIN